MDKRIAYLIIGSLLVFLGLAGIILLQEHKDREQTIKELKLQEQQVETKAKILAQKGKTQVELAEKLKQVEAAKEKTRLQLAEKLKQAVEAKKEAEMEAQKALQAESAKLEQQRKLAEVEEHNKEEEAARQKIAQQEQRVEQQQKEEREKIEQQKQEEQKRKNELIWKKERNLTVRFNFDVPWGHYTHCQIPIAMVHNGDQVILNTEGNRDVAGMIALIVSDQNTGRSTWMLSGNIGQRESAIVPGRNASSKNNPEGYILYVKVTSATLNRGIRYRNVVENAVGEVKIHGDNKWQIPPRKE